MSVPSPDPQRVPAPDAALSAKLQEILGADWRAYGLALLLDRGEEGASLGFALESGEPEASIPRWPDAAEFLRWLLSDEEQLALGAGPRRWTWQKLDGIN